MNRCVMAGLVLSTICWGCGAREPKLEGVFPVSGKIAFNGQPTPGAVVILWALPVNKAHWQARRSSGQVLEDGTFKVRTLTPDDGAAPGEYALTVVWDSDGVNPPGDDKFEGRYRDPEFPIAKVTVKQEKNELAPIELSAVEGRPQSQVPTGEYDPGAP